jgi:hypothetical protein
MQNSVMPLTGIARTIYDNYNDTQAGALRFYSVCCNKFMLPTTG